MRMRERCTMLKFVCSLLFIELLFIGFFISGTIQEASHFSLLLARTLRAMLAAYAGEFLIQR